MSSLPKLSEYHGVLDRPIICERDSRVNLFPRWSPDGTHLIFLSVDGWRSEYRSVAISGGAPQTIMQLGSGLVPGFGLVDVGRDGRLLYQNDVGEVQAFDPRDGKARTLGRLPVAGAVRWSADGVVVVYVIWSRQENDPAAGIWTTDFKAAPRQVFRGWASNFAVDAQNQIFILKGKADLKGELWKLKLDGSGLSRSAGTIPLLYDVNYIHGLAWSQMDVSPDGHRVVFQSQQVLQENIGIIDNLP
jgi:WD40-like Beta Propeller Repeat